LYLLREGVDDLLGPPTRPWMLGTADVQDLTTGVRQQDQHEEHAAGQSRDREENN
jgi:hypothetical protein